MLIAIAAAAALSACGKYPDWGQAGGQHSRRALLAPLYANASAQFSGAAGHSQYAQNGST